jgi:hypothetical protein
MTVTTIPFELNRKPGVLKVCYEVNRSITESGFDLFAGGGFDVSMCLGYPTMRARIDSYEGTGYYTACAWIQIVIRREFTSLEAAEPAAIVPSVDTHPTLAALGVPFFALGFPAEIFDAPCNNLNGLGKLVWVADTFLTTLPDRANDYAISRVAGFRWGYVEYDLAGKRQVESSPLVVTDVSAWKQHLPLLRSQFGKWQYREAER